MHDLYSELLVRLRKQSKPTAQPGDEFLRAVSSGRDRLPPAAVSGQAEGDFSGLREQLLESERRAVAANEALRQIREERDERLERAREALAQERSARRAAEQRLVEAIGGKAGEDLRERPASVAGELEPLDPEVAGHEPDQPEPGLGFPAGDDDRRAQEPAAADGEEGWPAPWLARNEPRRRGLFRRLRS